MRRSLGRILCAAAACAAGCGGSGPSDARGVPASHGGTVMPLPGGSGYVEILVAAGSPNDAGPKSRGRVVAYFLNTDGSGPPSPPPADVTFTDEAGKSYPLTPKAGGDAARFETGPGAFPVGRDLSGELKATIGGQAVSTPVATR